MVRADRIRTRKDRLIPESLGIQLLPLPERHGLPALLAVHRVTAFALALDLHDINPARARLSAFFRLFPDHEVRRIAPPLAFVVLVFYKEVGLCGIGERSGEINVLNIIRLHVQLDQHLFKEMLLRIRVKL